MTLKIFTDGGSRGNPGPAAAAFTVKNENDEILFQKGIYLGIKTNNEAEYEAFVASLEWVLENMENLEKQNLEKIEWVLDSLLVVEQINKKWKVKNERVKSYAEKAWFLLSSIKIVRSIKHIARAGNSLTDRIVNETLDEIP